ncbi:BrnT family toxin [Candidatus Binatus sp.]|uniref:BrnT family toxin n=1 Tax=Candidatus Binatus sp. TaxID=2811406 RepID=UPI003BAE612D
MQKVTFSGFAWDNANRSKCQKHGVSIAEMEHVLAHAKTLIVPDLKNSRAEPRFLAIGPTEEGRYTFVVFTPRQTRSGIFMRPISARYMHRKEIKKYEQEIARVQNR